MEETKISYTLFLLWEIKKKNKRIWLRCYRCDEDKTNFGFMIITKKLVDFKSRHIVKTETKLGLETFLAIKELMTMTVQEPMFLKIANPAIGQFMKDRYSVGKYVNEDI